MYDHWTSHPATSQNNLISYTDRKTVGDKLKWLGLLRVTALSICVTDLLIVFTRDESSMQSKQVCYYLGWKDYQLKGQPDLRQLIY